MSIDGILTMGRKFGYDNLVQLQNLRRGYKSGAPGKYSARFVFDSSDALDKYVAKVTGTEDSYNEIMQIVKKFFPDVLSEKAKTVVQVVLNRFSKKSGTVDIGHVVTNGEDIVSVANFRGLKNASATKYRVAASGGDNLRIEMNGIVPKTNAHFPEEINEFMDAVKYVEKDGVSKVGIDYKAKEGLTQYKVSVEAPKEYLDACAEVATQGQYKTVNELIERGRYMATPEYKAAQEAEVARLMDVAMAKVASDKAKYGASYVPPVKFS